MFNTFKKIFYYVTFKNHVIEFTVTRRQILKSYVFNLFEALIQAICNGYYFINRTKYKS